MPITGFNGANAFQRWIRGAAQSARSTNGWLQWGQRLSALDTSIRVARWVVTIGASMGPTPFSVGYDGYTTDMALAILALQWGQRLSALDTELLKMLVGR